MAKETPAPLSLQEQLQRNEIEQLDVLQEIDKLHKYIGGLYVERNYQAVSAHVPHLSRRWDAFNRLIIQRLELLKPKPEPAPRREAPKPTPFNYTRPGYDYD